MQEKTAERLREARQLVKDGLTIQAACKKAGVSLSAWYEHRDVKLPGIKSRPEALSKAGPKYEKLSLPDTTPKSFLIYGSASELAEFARSYDV